MIFCGSITIECPVCGGPLKFYVKGVDIETLEGSSFVCSMCHDYENNDNISVDATKLTIFDNEFKDLI